MVMVLHGIMGLVSMALTYRLYMLLHASGKKLSPLKMFVLLGFAAKCGIICWHAVFSIYDPTQKLEFIWVSIIAIDMCLEYGLVKILVPATRNRRRGDVAEDSTNYVAIRESRLLWESYKSELDGHREALERVANAETISKDDLIAIETKMVERVNNNPTRPGGNYCSPPGK